MHHGSTTRTIGDGREAAILLRYAAAMERLRQCRRAVSAAVRALTRGEAGADEALDTSWIAERVVAAEVTRLRAALAEARAAAALDAADDGAHVLAFSRAA